MADAAWYTVAHAGEDVDPSAELCARIAASGDAVGPDALKSAAQQEDTGRPMFLRSTSQLRCVGGIALKDDTGRCFGALSLWGHARSSSDEKRQRRLRDVARTVSDAFTAHMSRGGEDIRTSTYRKMIDDAGDAVFVVSRDGRFVDVNASLATLLQQRITKLLNRSLYQVLDTGTHTTADVRRMIKTVHNGRSRRCTLTLRRADGAPVETEARLQSTTYLGYPAVMGIARRAAGDAAPKTNTRSKATLRGMAEATPGVLYDFRVARDGSYVADFVSAQTESVLGIAPKPYETFFERFVDCLPAPHPKQMKTSIEQALEMQKSWTYETPFVRPDGRKIWLECRSNPQWKGDVLAYQGIIIDITEQRRTERALRRSEARLRGLANSLPGVIFQFQATEEVPATDHEAPDRVEALPYTLPYVSEAAEDILGLDPNGPNLLGTFIERVPSDHRATLLSSIADRVRNPKPWSFEIPYDHPNGERIWLQGASTPDADSDVSVYNGLLLDITSRRVAEQEVKETKNFYEQILDALPTELAVFDRDARFVYVNKSGVSNPEVRDWIIGCTNTEYCQRRGLPEAIGKRRDAAIRSVARTQEAETFEEVIPGPDGPRYYRRTHSPIIGLDGSVEYVIGHGPNITEQKEASQALRNERDRLATLFNALPIPLVQGRLHEDRMRFHSANPAFRETFGTFDAPEAPELCSRLAPEAMDEARALNRTLLEEGAVRAEVRRKTVEGYRDFEVQAVVRTSSGRSPEVYATYVDISDRVAYERGLQEAKTKAEEAARLKNAMLANMSHEVRTPLTAILGFSEVLADELAAEHERFARLIHQSSNRLLRTLNAVLDLARLDAQAYAMHTERLDIRELIRDTVAMLEAQADENNVTLTVHLPDAPLQGTYDKNAIERVLTNLLGNAIKFTPPGGTVQVRAERTDGWATIAVEDTGIGISKAFMETIFEAFTQESEGTNRTYEGTGLGLSITKRLVEAHDGTIAIESTKGEGTTVTVQLPCEEGVPAD
ncbi:PAS domain S-box protein [Salisaeta longa]|uniref:PAS domain S-box protein n=1 Tax=Salisaeta longa TaxID=503170 RepID=UPI0006881F0A|nr:PAS domain S-box protein [Salisaeta longa]